MIVRNYPSQELSDIIIKWKMKFSEQSQNELETITSPTSSGILSRHSPGTQIAKKNHLQSV